jgi:hypothetical protein
MFWEYFIFPGDHYMNSKFMIFVNNGLLQKNNDSLKYYTTAKSSHKTKNKILYSYWLVRGQQLLCEKPVNN